MGYDLHITRKGNWSDDDKKKEIGLTEWLAYIYTDPDLTLSDAYRIRVPGSETESQVAPGFCEWVALPSQESPWFDYSDGSVSTKNPDEDVIRKMLLIADALDAKVQGDDGEIYTLSNNNQILSGYISENKLHASTQETKRPWWKFW